MTIEDVKDAVCTVYDYPWVHIKGKRRIGRLSEARCIYSYILSTYLDMNPGEIGRTCDRAYHSIRYQIKEHANRYSQDPAYRRKFCMVMDLLLAERDDDIVWLEVNEVSDICIDKLGLNTLTVSIPHKANQEKLAWLRTMCYQAVREFCLMSYGDMQKETFITPDNARERMDLKHDLNMNIAEYRSAWKGVETECKSRLWKKDHVI